jgi:hypothetical protein
MGFLIILETMQSNNCLHGIDIGLGVNLEVI